METTEQTTTTETHKIITRDIKRDLPCRLTDTQLVEVATDHAKLEAEIGDVTDQFGDVKREWNKRIEDLEKRKEHLGGCLITRSRKSVVICHERVDAITRMVEVVREDTGEVVDRRVANLFEASKVLPETKHIGGDEIAAPGDDAAVDADLEAAQAESAAAQKAVGVEENEDGDVVPPEGEPKKKGRRK